MTSDLTTLSMGDLVDLHNRLIERYRPAAFTHAGPKTFSTKAKALHRIDQIAEACGLDAATVMAHRETDDSNEEVNIMARDNATLICSLLTKTLESGCTPGEEELAVEKALELIERYGLDRKAFTFPPRYTAAGEKIARAPEPKAEPAVEPAVEPESKPKAAVEPEPESKPKAEPKAEEARPKSGRIVRQVAEEGLLHVDHWELGGRVVDASTKGAVAVGVSYATILGLVQEEFPEAKTSIACLRWYAVHMNQRGERLPRRPRSPSKKVV